MGRVAVGCDNAKSSADYDWDFSSSSGGLCGFIHSFFSRDPSPVKLRHPQPERAVYYKAQDGAPKAVLVRYEREPDRDVDNDVYQRSREACGDYTRDSHHDYHRDRDSSLFNKREWSDTARDAADVTQKLWEASQMAKTGTGGIIAGGIKCFEAVEPAARVVEDIGKEATDRFVESRTDSVKGGYSQYSDMGFQ